MELEAYIIDEVPKKLCSYPIGEYKLESLMAPKEIHLVYSGHVERTTHISYFSMIEDVPYAYPGMYQDYVSQVWKTFYKANFSASFFFPFSSDNSPTYQLLYQFFSKEVDISDDEYEEILTKASFFRGFSTDIIKAFARAGALSEEQILITLQREKCFPQYIPISTQKMVAEVLDTETLLSNMDELGLGAFDTLRTRKEDIANIIRNSMTDFKGMPSDWVLKATDLDNLEDKRWDEISWLKNLL